MERREFILTGCKACAAVAAMPALLTLESCGGAKGLILPMENDKVAVPMADLGSKNFLVVSPKGFKGDILVVKDADGSYKAVSLKCTHMGGPVRPKGEGMECGLHGSQFTLAGKVTEGPAKKDLPTYPVTEEGQMLQVDLGSAG